MQYQVMNWYHFCWLSGDNICEQHVHNLDVGNWVMTKPGVHPKDAHPVEANGMGACVQRYRGPNKGVGQIFDEHFVEFTYADGTKMFSQCRHIPNTWGIVGEGAHGTKGTSNCANEITVGGEPWRAQGGKVNAMVQEHKDLIDAIREGKPYCEGWHGAASSMTAVLGRMATYSGRVVTHNHDRRHIARAFLEALGYQVRAILETVQAQTGLSIHEQYVGGGLSRADLACQVQADLTGIPVYRPDESETTARGAALLAGLAAGVWRSVDDLPPLPSGGTWFEPRLSAAQRDEGYARWQRAVAFVRAWGSQ
jgi:hypothetical protein